jgi:hypothetical protein
MTILALANLYVGDSYPAINPSKIYIILISDSHSIDFLSLGFPLPDNIEIYQLLILNAFTVLFLCFFCAKIAQMMHR